MSGKNPIPTRDPLVYDGANIYLPVTGFAVIKSKRDPTTNDKKYPTPSIWVNTVLQNIWIQTAPGGNWTELISSGAVVLAVANGGTGDSSLAAHGVLIGEGTSPVNVTAAGTNGQVLIAATGADPAFATISSSGSTLTLTGGANTLNIDIAAPVTVPNGGSGRITLTNHGVLVGAGTSAITQLAAASTGTVLAGVSSADPAFTALAEFNITDSTGTTQAMAVNSSYVSDHASATVVFTLPATASRGDIIRVYGNGPGGWQINQNANQAIRCNNLTTTTGTGGSLSSTNRYNCVELVAVVGGASTIWNARSYSGSFTFV